MDDFRDLDDRELERLLAGHAPEADLEPLAALLGELRSAYTAPIDEELARSHVALAAEAARLAPQPVRETAPQPISRFRRTRRRLATMLSTLFSSLAVKIATASLAAAAVAGAGAAATGNLPDDLQAKVSQAVAHVGIQIPAPEGDTAEGFQTGDEYATENADEEASPVVGEIFGNENPEDVDGESVADVTDGDRDDGDNSVDDPRNLDGDPTGNAQNRP